MEKINKTRQLFLLIFCILTLADMSKQNYVIKKITFTQFYRILKKNLIFTTHLQLSSHNPEIKNIIVL